MPTNAKLLILVWLLACLGLPAHGVGQISGQAVGCAVCGHPPQPPWHHSGCRYYRGSQPLPPPPRPRPDPRSLEAAELNRKGNDAWKRGDLEAAVKYYRDGLELLPDAVWLKNNLTRASAALENKKGNDAFARREWVVAIAHYRSALGLQPDSEVFQKNLRLAQDRLDREQEQLRQASNLEAAKQRIGSIIDTLADDLRSDQEGRSPFDSPAHRPNSVAPGSVGLTFVDPSNPQVLFQKPEQGGTVDLTFLDPNEPVAVDPEKVRAMPGGPTDTVSLLAMRQYVQRLQLRPDGSEPMPNSLDEQAVAQERELLKPVRMDRMMQLTEEEAVRFVIARQHAAYNEASRAASARIGRAFTEFERQGLFLPGDSLLEKQRTDPKFAAALQRAAREAADAEIQADLEARREAVRLLTAYYTRKHADAALQRKIEEATRRAIEREERDLLEAHRQTVTDMNRELEALRRQGVIRPGEDVIAREQRDPVFRQRMDEVVRRVEQQRQDRERQITSRTIRDLAQELGRLQQEHHNAIERRS